MSLGNTIRALRRAHHYTQQGLADKISISRVYMQAIETNKRLPSMKLLKKLAPALDVDLSDLMVTISATEDKPLKADLAEMLTSGELEIWYRSKKLDKKELHRVYRVIEATLDDWDEEDKKGRKRSNGRKTRKSKV
ncbi:MAG: helix-turn-helix transcriptional regulator [Synergistes sp.]|nr:helix-turn-helix transcriptional regulator [Synergistes sp.]